MISVVLSVFLLSVLVASRSKDKDQNYKLQFVILLTRHGDRAPCFNPYSDVKWNCTKPFSISTCPYNDQSPTYRLFNARIKTPTMIPGTCEMGQLTDLGMKELIALGQNLSKTYSSLVTELPQVRIRSSDPLVDQFRTLQSAQSFVHGFFPPTIEPDYRFDIDMRVQGKDDLFINYYASPMPCPLLEPLSAAIRAGKQWTELVNDTMPFRKYLANALGIGIDEVSYFILHDSFYCLVNNDQPLPGGLTNKDYWMIEKYASEQFMFYYSNTTFLKLGIGHFLGHSVVDLFTSVMNGSVEDQRLMLYSGHDTTIAPLGVALGFYGDGSLWPAYASNIRLELYNDENEEYYVKALYNGYEKIMTGCNNQVYCLWSDFLKNAQRWIPDDWEKECEV